MKMIREAFTENSGLFGLNSYLIQCSEESWWVSDEKRVEYYKEKARQVLEADGELLETNNGIVCMESAPFESSFFGLRMARIVWVWAPKGREAAIIEEARKVALKKGWHHLAIRLSSSRQRQVNALEDAGFRLMDLQATLYYDYKSHFSIEKEVGHKFDIGEMLPDDLEILRSMASKIFPLSRFYADPALSDHNIDKLHDQWIKNNCSGRAAANLVARVKGKPAGFISCLFHESQEDLAIPGRAEIDLIGVAEEHRKMGVAKLLLFAALQRFRGKVKFFTVQTQGFNYSAMRLYIKNGFELKLLEGTFHLLLENED